MYTLVVVDMQGGFPGALRPKVQANCKRAVAKAIKNKADIVFLEFTNHGPTLPCLTKLTRGYDRAFHVSKNTWSGSREVLSLVKKHNLNKEKFRLCGVYTDCCVKETLFDLHTDSQAKLELIHKACGAAYSYGQKKTIKEAREMKRIRIMER